jgi:hypothetical protein
MAVLIGLALAYPGTAGAATFFVNGTGDRPDADLQDAICAAANGKCTLRAAVSEANDEAGDDEINMPDGRFRLTRSTPGMDTESAGDLDITDDLYLNGDGVGETIIEQTVKDHVLSNFTGGVFDPVTIDDLTITGGRETGDGGPNAEGGGIYNEAALLLEGTALRGNAAMKKDSFGGAIWSSGILLISGSTIRDNRAKSRRNAAGGGAIYAFDGPVSIQDSRISGNVARSERGPAFEGAGGIRVTDNVTLDGVTIAGNRSRGDVGGLSLSGDLDMRDSTISGNSGDDAGGLFTNGAGSIENSTISGNVSRFGGSGIYRSSSSGTLTLSHVTLARNEAEQSGAGVFVSSDAPDSGLIIDASIVHNPGPDCAPSFSKFFVDLSVLGDSTCAGGGLSTNRFENPRIRDLADNGGPTRTHALRGSSPAVDHVASGCPPPAFDQREVARPQGDDCDAGAFERVVSP